MRVGARNPKSRIPEVNLVPMMDVLMTVLTFFVILSMTLNGQQIANIKLPEGIETSEQQQKSKIKPFLLGINPQGQLVRHNEVIKYPVLVTSLQGYFKKQPEGQILVVADKSLSYNKVTQILKGLRKIGGKRVSLATQPFNKEEQ